MADAPDPKTLWRNYRAEARKKPLPADIRVALAGSFTPDSLAPHIGGVLLQKGFTAPDFVIAPYNQIHQLCLDHHAVIGRDDMDVIIILWRIEDVMPAALGSALHGKDEAVDALLGEVRALARAVKKLKESFAGTVILSAPPYPSLPSFDARDPRQPYGGAALHRAVTEAWHRETAGLDAHALDLQALLANEGFAAAHDERKMYLYRQPYTEDFLAVLGRQTARLIAAGKMAAKKCIVLDADNTLWGGIVGEDGLSGIQLGDEFPGSAFRDFQNYLLHLRARGVLLAVASRNNPDDVYEVFDKHDAMVLKREHISVFEIGWDSKADSLRRIAGKLNIGTDALVFIDDTAKEIGEIQARLPEVTCLLAPEDPAGLPGLLRGSDLFDTLNVTAEDRSRAQMVIEEQRRQGDSARMSEEEFRAGLGLTVDVFAPEPQHMARIAQLINKTNQFNLTTIRRTQPEIEALARSGIVLAAEISDRYGAYGLTGAAILTPGAAPDTWVIDTLLMSCRVLGRGAETAFIAKLAEAAQKRGAKELRGKYIPTPKNDMVREIYGRHGFRQDEKTGEWAAKPADVTPAPDHIKTSLKLSDTGGKKTRRAS